MKAPEFSLQDQAGATVSLDDYAGRWVVLYFYPKDDTPGCTKEACSFRDFQAAFADEGIAILGMSADSVASHKKFAEKFNLNFPLLSDPSKETIKAYGAWGLKKFMGKEYEGILRSTFIINPEGNVVKEYKNVTPANHADQILQDFDSIKKG